jgi:hypothetical protein
MLEVDEIGGIEAVQQVVKCVRDTCRLREGGELLYRRFRQYVIEHPVVGEDSSLHDLLAPLGVDLPPTIVRYSTTTPDVLGWSPFSGSSRKLDGPKR